MSGRRRIGLLLVVVSGLFSVLLAVAINIATGGQLPEPAARYAWLAWPSVGLLAMIAIGLGTWQQILATDGASPVQPGAPAPARRSPPAQLPVAVPLIGRRVDLAAVWNAVTAGARVVVIAAAPGTGKTALALRVAHEARARYPDGQLYAPLRGSSADPAPPERVLAAFLDALGYSDDERLGSVEELAGRFRTAVADRSLLILLDDAGDPAQVRPLLPGGSGCLTLVTSRRVLAELPGAQTLTIGGMGPDDAMALLAATAGEDRIRADPDGARLIVEACAGLPLALRIAGGRLRTRSHWTPSALAALLNDQSRRLDELRVGDRAVRSSFQAAYDELPEQDRLVFRRAGAHPGPLFTVAAAAARCGLAEPAVRAGLERLVDAFLVETPAPDRYRLHDLLRLFAGERLDAEESPGERMDCLARQLGWLRVQASPGRWLADERDNILPVLQAAVDMGLTEPAWALADAVHPLLTAAGDHGYRLRLWQAAEVAARALGDDRRRARALRWISHSYGLAGQVRQSLAFAEQALALAEQLDDPRELMLATQRLGEALRAQTRFDAAEAALTRALQMSRELGDTVEELEMRSELGTLYNMLRQPESSIRVLEGAMELLPPEETNIHGWVRLGLGQAYKLAGRWEQADTLVHQAIRFAERHQDDFLLGWCLHEYGWLADENGRYADAERHFRDMLALFERIRHGNGVGAAYDALGTIAGRQGRHDRALAAFDTAIAQYERLGDTVHAGEVRVHRAATLRALGRLAEADREWELAQSLIRATPPGRTPAADSRLSSAPPAAREARGGETDASPRHGMTA